MPASRPGRIKLMVVVGARPQFIKAAALNRAIRMWNEAARSPHVEQIIVHTGQHYDHELSAAFFDELGIPQPDVNLAVGSGAHAEQTARMMIGLDETMTAQQPDWVLAFGDTNSTAAAILTAAKRRIPTAHVEAGLREHNRHIPEEINKIVSDHLADKCFAPTVTAMNNLRREGLGERSVLVGDIMLDTAVWMAEQLSPAFVADTLASAGVATGRYVLATTHRAVFRENAALLQSVLETLRAVPQPVVLPLHPSTRAAALAHGLGHLLEPTETLKIIPPVGYARMLAFLTNCRMVITDSGGLIKEAYYFRKPCITIDFQTEWIETLDGGWNIVTGPDGAAILRAASAPNAPDPASYHEGCFGRAVTATEILEVLARS